MIFVFWDPKFVPAFCRTYVTVKYAQPKRKKEISPCYSAGAAVSRQTILFSTQKRRKSTGSMFA